MSFVCLVMMLFECNAQGRKMDLKTLGRGALARTDPDAKARDIEALKELDKSTERRRLALRQAAPMAMDTGAPATSGNSPPFYSIAGTTGTPVPLQRQNARVEDDQ